MCQHCQYIRLLCQWRESSNFTEQLYLLKLLTFLTKQQDLIAILINSLSFAQCDNFLYSCLYKHSIPNVYAILNSLSGGHKS